MAKQQISVYISPENIKWLDDYAETNKYNGRSDALDGLLTYVMENEDITERKEYLLGKYFQGMPMTHTEYSYVCEYLSHIKAPFDVLYQIYGPKEGGAN